MTNAEKSTMLEKITGESDGVMLSTYLSIAESVILRKAFPFGDGTETMPTKYDTVQVEIAAYLINKRGAEGETAHSENGVTRYYADGDIPNALLRRIVPQGEVL